MKRYIGLDVHRTMIEACFIDEGGRILQRVTLASTRDALEQFARTRLMPSDQVALEATTNTWSIADQLRPHVANLVVGNPLQTKLIASARIKTDKVDATALAQLLRCDFLPAVWQPDVTTRRLRELSGHQAAVVRQQSRLKNRIQSILAQRLLHPPTDNLFRAKGRDWLRTVELDTADRLVIDAHLESIAQLEKQEAVLTAALAKLSYPLEDVRLLMTLPGVGATVAQAIVGALGDWRRFKDADHAASYLGLVPTVRQSAEHCRHGSITKAGNSHARWLLVQAAQHVGRHPGPLGVFFRRLVRRKHHNVAIVATARKLVTVAYHMLKHREPYRYALPARTQLKLSALRVAATGKRRRKGKVTHPLQPQPTGVRRRHIPELNAIYRAEGLPPVATEPTSPGEKRMMAACGGEKLLVKIHQPSTRFSRSRTAKPLTPVSETAIQCLPSKLGPEKDRSLPAPSLARKEE